MHSQPAAPNQTDLVQSGRYMATTCMCKQTQRHESCLSPQLPTMRVDTLCLPTLCVAVILSAAVCTTQGLADKSSSSMHANIIRLQIRLQLPPVACHRPSDELTQCVDMFYKLERSTGWSSSCKSIRPSSCTCTSSALQCRYPTRQQQLLLSFGPPPVGQSNRCREGPSSYNKGEGPPCVVATSAAKLQTSMQSQHRNAYTQPNPKRIQNTRPHAQLAWHTLQHRLCQRLAVTATLHSFFA